MKHFLLLLLSLLTFQVFAQIGGDNIYEFVNLPQSSRVTALGGQLITIKDDDVALAYSNPAVTNASMHGQLSFNYNFHLANIGSGYAAYGHHIQKWNTTFHGGVQYVNYGTFDAADTKGNITGTFKAAEYAVTLGAARQLYERMSVGANLKFISSQLEAYNSVGLVTDFAAIYQDTSSRFSAALVFKNVGTQLTTYSPDNQESIPFDVQLGISKKLRHLPFRISVTAHNLHRWNILYDDPNAEQATIFIGETQSNENQIGLWVDNFFRHLVFSGEFLLGAKENFRLRVGYNHLRRQELTVPGLRSVAGFSFGLGLKIKRFRIDFGRGFYHLAGGNTHLSLSTNLSEFTKKR